MNNTFWKQHWKSYILETGILNYIYNCGVIIPKVHKERKTQNFRRFDENLKVSHCTNVLS